MVAAMNFMPKPAGFRIALLLIAMLLSALPVQAQKIAAAYTVAETGRGYGDLQDAVRSIGGGTGVIIIRPGTYRDCAVQLDGHIAFRAAIPGEVIFDGGICEEKAALVLRGKSASVDGIIFQNMATHDRDGAGIRFEAGKLTVTRSVFRNSQQGILTAHDPSAVLVIDQSTFSGLGRCDDVASCAHSIYGGNIASLTVTNCRFERGTGGHYIKFRGKYIAVRDSAFDDSNGINTNYMIDLPNGSTGEISGNMFVQGPHKENSSALIAVSPEGKENSSAGLAVFDNDASLAPGAQANAAFVADWSGTQLDIGSNRLGRGITPYVRR
jgi:hypothetical protein